MSKVSNNMDNKYDEYFIITKYTIEADKHDMKTNKQKFDDKCWISQNTSKQCFASITDQINNLKSLPTQKDSSNPPDPTIVVLANMTDTPLEGGHSIKIGGMWNLKHEISSTKFYKIIIKT